MAGLKVCVDEKEVELRTAQICRSEIHSILPLGEY